MDKAKGFFDKLTGGGSDGRVGTMAENKRRFGMGIGNTPGGVMPISTGTNNATGYIGRWGEDRITNIAICIRGLQVVFVFCMLITVIVLATFQNRWIGAISGLTGLLIIVTVFTFLFCCFLLALSFMPSSLQLTTDRIINAFEQPRLGLVMNGLGLAVWLILSITQTASALGSPACKDPASDPHAKSSKGNSKDFVNSLPSFCSTKKAGSAFCWLIFLTCVATMLLFLRFWRLSRKNGPRIPPFVHPTDEGAFQPIADDFDAEADEAEGHHQNSDRYQPTSNRYGDGGDGTYGYGEGAPQHGGYGNDRTPYNPSMAPVDGYTRSDPFADSTYVPRQSYDYGAYGAAPNPPQDPYAAIQSQLRNDRPPQLPPIYRG